jgi:hypothetical protein
MPAFAGMTEFRTFYEFVNVGCSMFDVQGLKSASGGFTVPAGGVSYEMSDVMERRC